jgi:hypothetical protein
LCCITGPDEQQKREINALLDGSLDWDYIFTIAKVHGIGNLIFKNMLNTSLQHRVPGDILTKLQRQYHKVGYQNLLFLKEYETILSTLIEADIPVLPLKGIDFLQTIYSNIALRGLSDIDILVKKHDLEPAIKAMIHIGYRKVKSAHDMDELFHVVFTKKREAAAVMVELHWDLDIPQSPFKINVDDFWSRATVAAQGKNIFYRLSPEDAILFTAFHILRAPLAENVHDIVSLRGLIDVCEMIKHYGSTVNWNVIFERAQRYQVERPIFLVLYLLEMLFCVSARENVIEALKAKGFQEEMAKSIVGEWIFSINRIDDIFLPSILEVAKPDGGFKKLSFSSVFHTAYVVLRHQYRTAPSLMDAVRVIRIKFWRSCTNYFKILYFMVCDYGRVKKMMQDALIKKQHLKQIDGWIRSNP